MLEIIKMQNEQIEGMITIGDNDYYFDGNTAYPIKCQCGGTVARFTELTNLELWNDETKLFDKSIGGEIIGEEFRCVDCDKELNEYYPDKKGNWW